MRRNSSSRAWPFPRIACCHCPAVSLIVAGREVRVVLFTVVVPFYICRVTRHTLHSPAGERIKEITYWITYFPAVPRASGDWRNWSGKHAFLISISCS
jgi:hypothetical protein